MLRCLLIAAVALAGCAHNVRTRFPSDPADSTGTVILKFTSAASDVTVTVNGVLVVDGEDTERVQIDGIPIGRAELSIAAGPGEKQMEVWISPDNPTTIPLGSPGQSGGGGFVKSLIGSVVTIVIYSLLN
jgi:hypothetical protein